jgi:5,10-methenyltetrahydrofolate synthetase
LKYKELRREFVKKCGATARSELIANLQRFLKDYSEVQCGLYRALPEEAPCAVGPAHQFFFPVVQGDDLEFFRPQTDHSFARNRLGIEEPIREKSSPLSAVLPAVLLCPAIAVDRDGNRLGTGGGYYDRFLTKHPNILRVGVVFHVQIATDPLPAESADQSMDWIVSEKMILRTSPIRSSQSWT